MSYTVIARKYRPQSFTELIGQDHVSTTLLNSLRADRLHHAILLTGPRGTGKTSTARILAKAVRCPNAKNFNPCNECPDCEDIAQSRSVDVTEIDGASNNGVEAVREIRESVGYMPSSGSKKVYIIDEVHMLSTSAFNALLKTLEEPPAHVLFIFATTDVHKLPATILSRVQRFDFRKIPTKEIVKCLAVICEKEGVKFTDEALWLIAKQASGSLRDSQSLLDQAVSFSQNGLTEQSIRSTFGLSDQALLSNLAKALLTKELQQGLAFLETFATAGVEPLDFLTELIGLYKDLILLKTYGQKAAAILDAPDSVIKDRLQWVEGLVVEDLHYTYDMLLKGFNDIQYSPDTAGSLQVVLLRILAAPKMTSLAAMLAGKVPMLQTSAPVATKIEKPLPAEASPKPAAAQSFPWLELIQKIRSVNPKLGSILEGCTLIAASEAEMTLGVTGKMDMFFEQLNSESGRTKVANYIKTFYGKTLAVQFIRETDSSRLSPQQEAEQRIDRQKQELRAKVEQHPVVQKAREQLKAEIKAMNEL